MPRVKTALPASQKLRWNCANQNYSDFIMAVFIVVSAQNLIAALKSVLIAVEARLQLLCMFAPAQSTTCNAILQNRKKHICSTRAADPVSDITSKRCESGMRLRSFERSSSTMNRSLHATRCTEVRRLHPVFAAQNKTSSL